MMGSPVVSVGARSRRAKPVLPIQSAAAATKDQRRAEDIASVWRASMAQPRSFGPLHRLLRHAATEAVQRPRLGVADFNELDNETHSLTSKKDVTLMAELKRCAPHDLSGVGAKIRAFVLR